MKIYLAVTFTMLVCLFSGCSNSDGVIIAHVNENEDVLSIRNESEGQWLNLEVIANDTYKSTEVIPIRINRGTLLQLNLSKFTEGGLSNGKVLKELNSLTLRADDRQPITIIHWEKF